MTVPAGAEDQQRAAGFFFNDIAEIDALAQLLLAWLDAAPTTPITEGGQT